MLKILHVLIIGAALVVQPIAAHAEADAQALLSRLIAHPKALPSYTNLLDDKDDALRITSNKDLLLRLDKDAAAVIVNNPETVSIMLDSPRLLILMPRKPGATSFTVLDGNGDLVMQRDVIVSNVQSKYVRIRKMCNGADTSCQPAAYYYCPDGCYEVTPVTATAGDNIPPPPAVAAKEALDSQVKTGNAPTAPTNSGETP